MDKDGNCLLLGNPHVNLRKNVDGREAGRKKKTMKNKGTLEGKNKDQPFAYFF
jgi:hypothetical protein